MCWGVQSILRVKQGRGFPLQPVAGSISEGYTNLFCFLGPGEWETVSFGAGARVLVGWRARILEQDARLWLPRCRASLRRAGHTRLDASHLPPGPDSDLQALFCGSDLREHLPRLFAAPGVCSASPSDSPGSQASPSCFGQSAPLPLALACTPANGSARHGPPPPGGRGKAGRGRVRPPRVGCARGSRRRAARAGGRG